MTGQHWTVILLMAGAIVAQIGGLENWHDALTPAFVAGTLAAILAVLRAIFLEKPQSTAADTVKVPR